MHSDEASDKTQIRQLRWKERERGGAEGERERESVS